MQISIRKIISAAKSAKPITPVLLLGSWTPMRAFAEAQTRRAANGSFEDRFRLATLRPHSLRRLCQEAEKAVLKNWACEIKEEGINEAGC